MDSCSTPEPSLFLTSKFSDRDRLEMALQANCPGLTDIQYQAAMERILQEEYYRGVSGIYSGPIPPEIVPGDTAPRGIWVEPPEDPPEKAPAPKKAPQKAMPAGKEKRRHQRW